jgi:ubiquinone/menaquinone biosynthesis C-methylase UbiE
MKKCFCQAIGIYWLQDKNPKQFKGEKKMNTSEIRSQYNNCHTIYSQNREEQDLEGNTVFYKAIDFDLNGKLLLDVGCGSGADAKILSEKNAIIYGIDPSEEFLTEARTLNPGGKFSNGVGEDIPFGDEKFDVVVSKYALQTAFNVPMALSEICRVLKPGGMAVLLCKHPIRQWIERVRDNGHGSNYYEQVVVTSNIFDGQITLKEPSHTISEYFNPQFLQNFELIEYAEGSDFPASEQIDGDVYPTFFLIKARKK